MPTRERDAISGHAADDASREKLRSSKSDRKSEKDHHRRSSKSSRSKFATEGSQTHSSLSTKRHRRKDKDRDRDRDRDKENISHETEERESPVSAIEPKAGLSSGLENGKRISLPYPSFSKAHSKEAVLSREDIAKEPSNPLTPEPTDVGENDGRSKSEQPLHSSSSSRKPSRPPTPPDTEISADRKRSEQHANGGNREDQSSKSAGSHSSRATPHDDRSKVSPRSTSSSQATFIQTSKPKHESRHKIRSSPSSRVSTSRPISLSGTRRSSKVKHREPRDVESPPSSVKDSSPKTPTQPTRFSPYIYDDAKPRSPPSHNVGASEPSYPLRSAASAPPPPPPPPAVGIHDVPRVDYLLQNGGLPHPVSRNFLSALPPKTDSRASAPPPSGAEALFAPFSGLLDQYSTVLSRQGSMAVATGHRSVARRLLDRLENVFSRDLPPNGCSCLMCHQPHDLHRGLTWGDVLEWVSGRIELPAWPPFDLASIGAKAAAASADVPRRPASPVKMDPDIGEEFREHYLRQSKKVRSAVDRWLNKTGDEPVAPPPQEVDDETLAFAILTNMQAEDRPYFNALLSGVKELKPAIRAPSPNQRPRNEFLIRSGLSLQRLYRLSQVPRDAECAVFLVKNPHAHDLLIAISDINTSEWEILTSGRFDGFLWSGADADEICPTVEPRSEMASGGTHGRRTSVSPGSRGPSVAGPRMGTPLSPYSRGTTPASFVSLASSGIPGGRQPVSNDEEMEMAAIAEIEREIYTGMELLEDAFEKLHHKAEVVRAALRQRGAGLMHSFQHRRRVEVLSAPSHDLTGERSTPGIGSDGDGKSDDEWAFDDVDIMPDDSASNISSSRHRRPKRRTERRTPAPIEEDEEEREG